MSETASTERDPKKGPLDLLLSVFADVKAGEGLTAIILMFDVFLMLVAYYLLKTVREPLILEGGGVEVKSYATICQAVVLMGFVPAYAGLTKRLPRMTLITATMLFFASNLVLFWLLALLKVPYVGVVFYVWLGCFSLCVIAQFWSLANDLYTPEQGKRLFAIIGIGSSTGAVAGSYLAKWFTQNSIPDDKTSPPNVDPFVTMLVSAGILLLCLALSWLANKRETSAHQSDGVSPGKPTAAEEKPMGGKNGFSLLLEDRYLLLIAALIFLLNVVNTFGEAIFDLAIIDEAKRLTPDYESLGEDAQKAAIKAFVGPFRADFFFWTNLVGAVAQLFIVSRVFKYLGVRIALLSLPVIGLIAYGGVALYPALAYIRLVKIAENGTDYSLYNTTKQALWLPTTREQKYNAKMTIDSFIVRIGDLVAAVTVILFVNLNLGIRAYALTSVAIVAVWLVIAVVIGRENAKKTEATAG